MANAPPPPFGSGSTVAEVPIPPDEIAIRLGCAAALGLAVAVVYFLTQRKKRAESASFVSTLVLLTILLAMVSMVIGSDIARAFSLVGALSIVRFRTVVEDTRDTAFVIFAVIAGMAAGAEKYLVPLIGIPLIGVLAWVLAAWGRAGGANGANGPSPWRRGDAGANTLVVRMGLGFDPDVALAAVLAEHTESARLVAVATTRQGAAVDLTYAVRPKPTTNPIALLAAVNKVEGVQNVEWSAGEKK
jgi:hypothetical protein